MNLVLSTTELWNLIEYDISVNKRDLSAAEYIITASMIDVHLHEPNEFESLFESFSSDGQKFVTSAHSGDREAISITYIGSPLSNSTI